jgi:RHS repeat-associated protein
MSKTVNGSTTKGVWNLAEGLPAIVQDGSTKYITGPGGLPIEQVAGDGTVLYYLQDQLGSTRGLTDSSGTLVGTFSYDAYGNVTSSTGTATTPFGYAGQYTDSESGLQYLRARYYDPQTAQFLSVDPLVGLTQQPYGYAGLDPMNEVDPTGEWGVGDIASGVTRAAGVVVGAARAAWNSVTSPPHHTLPPSQRVNGVVVTAAGVKRIAEHLSRFADEHGGPFGAPYNEEMLHRLEGIAGKLVTGCQISPEDANFYEHELYEAQLMDQGYSYDEAHSLALKRYGVTEYDLYAREVYEKYRSWMGTPEWDEYWGIRP